jgi:photosystem II stability/assembly factor-like uncharacterized protein
MKIVRGLVMGAALACAAAPASALTLFGMVNTGELFASTNSGATWTARSTLTVTDAVALAAGLSPSNLYLVTASGTLYSSGDAGVSWLPTGTLSVSDATDLALNPGGALSVLTQTGGVYRSTDNGATFTAIAAVSASNFASLAFLASQTYFALTESGDVARSTDGGASWSFVGTIPVSDAVQIRALTTSLYVLSGTGDVYKSTDQGATWAAVGTLSQVGMTGMTRAGNQLVAITREGHTATSSNGVTWTWVGSINQLRVTSLGVDTPATGVDVTLPPGGPFALSPPWPNPRRGGASTFHFRIEGPETLRFYVFDVGGRLVASRAPESFASAGAYVVSWDPGHLAGGVYFVRLASATGRADGTRWAILR